MALIFIGSACRLSVQDCARIIGPIVDRFLRSPSPEALTTAVWRARKCAHVVEYAVLAVLLCWALDRLPGTRPRRWSKAGVALAIAVLYGASDEFHQLFVPSRVGSVADVLIDACGAVLGIAGFYATGALWRRNSPRMPPPAGGAGC
jgi:VanZ family protein